MFAVIFEVHPPPGKKDEYLAIAARLKPTLETMEGFIDNERSASLERDGWVLSLSTWRDEKSVIRWRTQQQHHGAQQRGRGDVFQDYHLRVGEITADTRLPAGCAIAEQRFDVTEVGVAKVCTITELAPDGAASAAAAAQALAAQLEGAGGLVAREIFDGITRPGKQVLLASWSSAAAAAAWQPAAPAGVGLRHRQVRVIRDYGLRERREAPQFYPDVPARQR